MNFKNLFIFFFLSTTSLMAADKNWQLILANGDTIFEVYMQDLLDDLLMCSNTHLEFVYLIPVDAIGQGLGKLFGGIIGVTSGAVIGGVIGAISGNDVVYDLSQVLFVHLLRHNYLPGHVD